jgi:hypothetical protein
MVTQLLLLVVSLGLNHTSWFGDGHSDNFDKEWRFGTMRISSSNFAVLSSANDVSSSSTGSPKPGTVLMAPASSAVVDAVINSMTVPINKQLVDQPVIIVRNKADESSQQVQPKGTPNSGFGIQPTPVPAGGGCEDGSLANSAAAVGGVLGGEATGGTTGGEEVGGQIGKGIGELGCKLGDATGISTALGAFASSLNPDNWVDYLPSDHPAPGNDGCSDPGAAGGGSAGTMGGVCKDLSAGGSSSGSSYVDSTTGELITNEGGTTTAGDPNADKGTYIGEADDPSFTDSDQSCHDDSTTGSADDKGGGGSFPADDSSGGGTPRSDNFPADDSAGGGTPRSMNYFPADDSTGGGTPRSNVAFQASLLLRAQIK